MPEGFDVNRWHSEKATSRGISLCDSRETSDGLTSSYDLGIAKGNGMDWGALFQYADKAAPATDVDIAYLHESVLSPLTENEIAEINARQQNPFSPSDPLYHSYSAIDASKWQIPRRRFPESLVDFLQWSNGGNFERGEWLFNMFPTSEIRGFLLGYDIPEYMPGAVPFAFDGAGGFYLFDMRNAPVSGEYPIVSAHAGSLGWADDDEKVADSFAQAILNRLDQPK